MGLFDKFRKKPEESLDFSGEDSREKAEELAKRGILRPLYLMPLRFGGEESEHNRLWVPPAAVELKDRWDGMVEQLLRQGKVNGYACTPEYKGDSFVPSRITVEAKMDGRPVFTESVSIW